MIEQVVDLIHVYVQLVHLLVDGIEVLGSAVHLALYAQLLHLRADLIHYAVQKLLPLSPLLADALRDILVLIGIEIHHGEVLKLALEEGNAQSSRKRRIDVQRLARHSLLLFGGNEAQRTHVV